MINQPGAADLLQEARTLLLEAIAPELDADQRYQALMIANAMGIAGREASDLNSQITRCEQALRQYGDYASEQALAEAIARRELDVTDDHLQELLLTLTRAKLELNNPGYLRQREGK
ncbi:acyl-CoA dehydrogenase [Marinobacter sp. NP-4(2019)]|uniref:DUF6285 domain-containing protein n=1 Tax=Marinobacter sp. NP-4(2019) TaxID=2488665 RepID=UPI000FC3ED9B|nr:DUF6285 domain-containing protein [Marinobacter sp. NP-4(2019)]AZT82078.1 acyl-CoA dehydrogenase [Marinobacter sp. NP-4(2019)]